MPSPRIISAVISVKDDKILLIKEILENKKEYWIFPGGGVEFGESVEKAAVREMKEETGLDVRLTEFLGFKEVIRTEFDYHTVVFFYLAEPISDKIMIGDRKILDAKYFTLAESVSLPLVDSARWAIEEIVKKGQEV